VLRHHPESEGLAMDGHGWVLIAGLLRSRGARARGLTRAVLERVVAENEKQRFEVDESGGRIRARQGHSVAVQLDWKEAIPPDRLYHGTATHALASIRAEGLRKGTRHHVHLSLDAATARRVGARHGRPAVLVIRAKEMREQGYRFFVSSNGIWLTEEVPPDFIDFPDTEKRQAR